MMNTEMKVYLCGSGHCPKVITSPEEVIIGEEGNMVKLKSAEWNTLVEKIREGELGKL